MALVLNAATYPLDITGGAILAAGEQRNIDVSGEHEQLLIADGKLRVLDPDQQPPAPIGRFTLDGSLTFSQSVASIGTSGVYRASKATHIKRLGLTCSSAPVGSALTVQVRVNGSTIGTLTITAGSTTDAESWVDLPLLVGDKVSVHSTSVGSTTPAGDVVVQLDLGH